MDNLKTQKNAKKRINEYICDLCNYDSKNKTDYNRHLLTNKHIYISNKQEIYDENINIKYFVCECGKSYKLRQGLYKHKQKCTATKSAVESKSFIEQTEYADKNTLLDILLKERQQFEKDKQELLEQFEKDKLEKEELQNQVELEKQNVETERLRNTIHNGNNINNDNLNIQINAFGCENLEYISEEFKLKCVKQIYKSIPEMVIKIHFNTKYPENHNVKIPNKKLPYASIMTADNKWKTVNKNGAVSSMVDKSFNILDDTYEEHKGKLSETKRKNYERYQDKFLNNDKELHKQLENEVGCLVLDGTR